MNLPSSVTKIEARAFNTCSSLTTTVDLSNTKVESIGESAFLNDKAVTSLVLPATLKGIGQQAFRELSKLTSVELPSGLETLADYSFYDCGALEKVYIPASVTSIGTASFYNFADQGPILCFEGASAPGDVSSYLRDSETNVRYNVTLEEFRNLQA